MTLDFSSSLLGGILDVVVKLLPTTLAMAAICTLLFFLSTHACNPQTPWWRNRGLLTDAWYWLITPFVAPYIRVGLLIAIAAVMLPFVGRENVVTYIREGYGPLSGLPFWAQAVAYVGLTDFILYWIHRRFHGAMLWRFHAIHHSAEDVDWTTAYRFHPVNLCLGTFLADALMLYLGISPAVLLYLAPVETMVSLFVHANLNWTFGPLKYVIATPVFHRWHHSAPELGGEKNFAPTFALWDVLFGTFYMPKGALPQSYGVDDPNVPQGFWQQLVYPFRTRQKASAWPQPLTASASVPGSAEPPR